MTNFELIKKDEELLKDILSGKQRIAVIDGKLALCEKTTNCLECDFDNSLEPCKTLRRRWLDQETIEGGKRK